MWDKLAKKAGEMAENVKKTVGEAYENLSESSEQWKEDSKKLSENVKKTLCEAQEKISESYADFKEDAIRMAEGKLKELIGKIKFEEIYEALDKYEKEKGGDVSALRDFIVKLQKYSNDGK